MDSRKKQKIQELFKALVKIKDDINKQIPLASNRYEEFECVPMDPSLAEQEKRAILDQVDIKYFEHERKLPGLMLLQRIYDHLNVYFKEFLQEHDVPSAAELPERTRQKFIDSLQSQAGIIATKVKRISSLLGKKSSVQLDDIEKFLEINKEILVDKLIQNGSLQVDNEDLVRRHLLDMKLAEHRARAQQLFLQEKADLLKKGFDEKLKGKLIKYNFLAHGLYFDQINTETGYCDEHTCIGLKRIFDDKCVWDEDIRIEKISLIYLDDNNEPDDGHAFLVINRNPDSPLNKIAEWGDQAILFDPWNKLVCFAKDFHQLPIHYLSFPEGCNWSIAATYNYEDRCLLSTVRQVDEYFTMTGNTELVDRIPRLMEEFSLFPFTEELQQTKLFLASLIEKLRPENFSYEVELFITTEGKKLITPLAGFNEPKLAIHQAFLLNMNGKEEGYTLEELEFALANALIYIQRHWAGMSRKLSAIDQHKVDQLAVEKTRNGPAAISFLRKQIAFGKTRTQEAVYLPEMVHSGWDRVVAKNPERIKALMTLFALDQYHYLAHAENKNSISPEISKEVKPLKRIPFFKEDAKKVNGTVNKLKYLQTRLPELKIELVPYEVTHRSSVRVRDFCKILMEMKIDLTSPQQRHAVDDFINEAMHLRIPAFIEIYFALQQRNLAETQMAIRHSRARTMQPIGAFGNMQHEIDRFVHAKTSKQALDAIEGFYQQLEILKPHLDQGSHGDFYVEQYQKEHHDQVPTGEDRFFGSSVGDHIAWQGFVIEAGKPFPWIKHLNLAKRDPSGKILQHLWKLGVQNYQPLWEACEPLELLKLNHQFKNRPFIYVHGPGSSEISDDYASSGKFLNLHKYIIAFLIKKHKFEKFNPIEMIPFRDRLKQFIDNNWPMLMFPSTRDKINIDNEAVHELLNKFLSVALNGSDEEKQVVKDFFFGSEPKYSIKALVNFESDTWGGHLDFETVYMDFLFKQEWQGQKFKLFTQEELIKLLQYDRNKSYIHLFEIKGDTWRQLFELPFETMTIDCLEQLVKLLEQHKLEGVRNSMRAYFHQTKPQAFTKEAERIVRLIVDNEWALRSLGDTVAGMLQPKSFTWVTEGVEVSDVDLIYLYRVYDTHFTFPELDQKEQAGKLVLKTIDSYPEEKQLTALEQLLFIDEHPFPLTDILLRNEVVNRWVKLTAEKVGKDDGSEVYYENVIKIIKKLNKKLSSRDKTQIFEKLVCAIEAQRKICDYIGSLVDPKKFIDLNNKKEARGAVQLALASKYFGKDAADQKKFIDFLSTPISAESLEIFASYIENHQKLSDFMRSVDPDYRIYQNKKNLKIILQTIYFNFWDCTLDHRAVMIDHLIIPANKVTTDSDIAAAYADGFDYISKKLFPFAEDPTSDEHFAVSMMRAYLNTADKYIRGILLSGMLVASNETSSKKEALSAGKKIAMLCEHMGPAYIKLAQAVHSHPKTPENIRRDLDHVKGKANPPYRWDLWRLIVNVIPKELLADIKRIGKLLGSASYNLALEAELVETHSRSLTVAARLPHERLTHEHVSHERDESEPRPSGSVLSTSSPTNVVLLLLRENAKHDAKKGFKHLGSAVEACQHDRMTGMRPAIVSILDEAQALSRCEMNKEASEKQYQIAAQIYPTQLKVESYTVDVKPVALYQSGKGYRLIERVYGEEFNFLPNQGEDDQLICRTIARAVISVELKLILSGNHFDSDRHGNQLRAEVDFQTKQIKLGLYDFGEMGLEKPSEENIEQLAIIIKQVPSVIKNEATFAANVENLLSIQIDKIIAENKSANYLMRLRKAFLALNDFSKVLTKDDMLQILKEVGMSNDIHPTLKGAMKSAMVSMAATSVGGILKSVAGSFRGFFTPSNQEKEIKQGKVGKIVQIGKH